MFGSKGGAAVSCGFATAPVLETASAVGNGAELRFENPGGSGMSYNGCQGIVLVGL